MFLHVSCVVKSLLPLLLQFQQLVPFSALTLDLIALIGAQIEEEIRTTKAWMWEEKQMFAIIAINMGTPKALA